MKRKLIMTAAVLLALTSLAGCNVNAGDKGGESNSQSKRDDTYATVTFDLNYAGAPAAETVQVEKGDYIDPPENDPVREGYFFNGWYDNPTGTGVSFDFYLTSIDEDITLYADWAAAYTVTFYLNKPEAAQDEVYQAVNVKAGELVTKPTDPKISKFEFAGWYKSAACAEGDEFSFSTSITQDLSLYAKWQEPDWGTVKKAIDNYLSFLSIVDGVTVPQFPNGGYSTDDRSATSLKIYGPEKCLTEYKPILEAAGYEVSEDAETEVVTATSQYITLVMDEDETRGDQTFTMQLKINGAGESTTFNDLIYQIGTKQNFVTVPAAAKTQFNKFNCYKSVLRSGGDCAVIYCYLDNKPADSTQTDEEYYNAKVKAFMDALGSNYFKGTFSNDPSKYFIDKAYLTMNQVSSFDETAPLRIELLCYNYCAQYGQGTTINKLDKDVFAAACNAASWRPKAAFELDLSDITATNSANGKNFILSYDTAEDEEEGDSLSVDILGVKTGTTSANAVNNKIIAALEALEDWEVYRDSSNKFQYAYHFAANSSGAIKVDAKLVLEKTSNATIKGITGGQTISIVLTPLDAEWNAKAVSDYFEKQALPGDEAKLPAYEGDFAALKVEKSANAEYLDIQLLRTKKDEALAYKDKLLTTEFGYTVAKSDVEKGEYTLRSASDSFDVELFIGDDTFEIAIVSFCAREVEFATAFDKLDPLLSARNGFEFPAAAKALLTANYTKVEYASFFYEKAGLGYTEMNFVSNIASVGSGEDNPVELNKDALINYFKGEGYSASQSTSGADLVKKRGKTIYFQVVAPSAADKVDYYTLEITVTGNNSEPLDDGHVVKISDTDYSSDNGDVFLLNLVNDYIKGKFADKEDSTVPSFYSTLADPTAVVETSLHIYTNLESRISVFYYTFTYTFTNAADINAAATAYIAALKALGYKHAEFGSLTPTPVGYWNASSGEFVDLSAEDNELAIMVFYIGSSTYREGVELTPESDDIFEQVKKPKKLKYIFK